MIAHAFELVGAVLGGLVVGILLAIAYGSLTFPTRHNSDFPGKSELR